MQRSPDILLVDDDEINNFLTEELIRLVEPNAEIHACTKVADALEYLETRIAEDIKLPDAILVDLNMPIVNGWDFVTEFEAMKSSFKTPVKLYIYTSSAYYEDINKAKTYSSVSALFTKPLTQEMIVECCKG